MLQASRISSELWPSILLELRCGSQVTGAADSGPRCFRRPVGTYIIGSLFVAHSSSFLLQVWSICHRVVASLAFVSFAPLVSWYLRSGE